MMIPASSISSSATISSFACPPPNSSLNTILNSLSMSANCSENCFLIASSSSSMIALIDSFELIRSSLCEE